MVNTASIMKKKRAFIGILLYLLILHSICEGKGNICFSLVLTIVKKSNRKKLAHSTAVIPQPAFCFKRCSKFKVLLLANFFTSAKHGGEKLIEKFSVWF